MTRQLVAVVALVVAAVAHAAPGPQATGFNSGTGFNALGSPTKRNVAQRFAEVVNVKDFGAKGDGTTDDRAAIQAAIDAAKVRGTPQRTGSDGYTEHDRLGSEVYFPPGRYMVAAPLVMPRSGNYPAHALKLRGAGGSVSVIAATAAFPTGRAIIEWEAVARRVQRQEFADLGLDPMAVVDGRAMQYTPTNKTTWAAMNAEAMYFVALRRLVIFGENTRNQVGIRIEGAMDHSVIEDVVHDTSLGLTPTYSTKLLEFDSDLLGKTTGSDTSGFNFGVIRNLSQGMRGGRGTLLVGRVGLSRIENVVHGVGALNHDPAVRLVNCGQVTIDVMAFEGRGELAELDIDGCNGVFAQSISLGITSDGGGAGIRVTNSTRVNVKGRYSTTGIPAFSAYTSKLLILDNLSTYCTFTGLAGNAPFADEVTWGSTGASGNRIEYVDVGTGVRTVRDETAFPTVLASRHIGAVIASTPTLYANVLRPRPYLVTHVVADVLVAAASGAGTVTFTIADGTNTCTCAGSCTATGSTGFGDTGGKSLACTGTCRFPGTPAPTVNLSGTCATTKPNVLSFAVLGLGE